MPTITLTLTDFEFAAIAVSIALIWLRPQWFASLHSLPSWWIRIAARPARAITAAGLLGFSLSVLVSLCHPVEPRFHDEFSYLLGADTLARGRLTNPTPAFWQHFESFHVIVRPSYQSKYPPGQAVLLAAGQVLTGQALFGVWLGAGLASAGLCWMLLAFVPARWALVGALLPWLRFGIFDNTALFAYWARSYWGGALAMLGGALVYGAMRRLVASPRAVDGVMFGLGGGVLLLTRPLEGAIASLPAIAVVLWWMVRQRGSAVRVAFVRVALPATLAFAPFLLSLGLYHQAVTGDPLTAPYQVYEWRHSGGIEGFFSSEDTSSTRESDSNQRMRSHYETLQETRRTHMSTPTAVAAHSFERLKMLAVFFVGPLLILPLVLNFSALLANRWSQLALATCAGIAIEVGVLDYVFPHYFAPVTGLLLLLVVQSLRSWQGFRVRGKRVGGAAVRVTLLLCVLSFGLALAEFSYRTRTTGQHWNHHRAEIARRLEATPGQHLVLVVYGEDRPNVEAEWVYNGADIEGAKVVWARSLGRERNAALRRHFAQRKPWMAWVDERPISLKALAR